MKSVNKVILLGRLGKDVELRYTAQGTAVATFSIATDESYKDQSGQKVEKTSWHNIVVWGKLAEIAGQYLKKGVPVYLEGKLQTRNYDGKDGVKRYVTEVVVSDIVMLGGKRDESHADFAEPSFTSRSLSGDNGVGKEEKDELPF